jgi:hypothetical protein
VLGVDLIEFGGDGFLLPGHFQLSHGHVVLLDEGFFCRLHWFNLHEFEEGGHLVFIR